MPTRLLTAERYYATSARMAQRAVSEARRARSRGPQAVALVIAQHQASQAAETTAATSAMLAEQRIRVAPEATVNPTAFTTEAAAVGAMLEQAEVDWQFERLVASLIQDAGRAAQQVGITSRPRVQHVRHLSPPSCGRCAVLAGRVYPYSEAFKRHPGCDCVMIPVTVASPNLTYDPNTLARSGQIAGLSKADQKALADGADFNQIVNVRRSSAGLRSSGEALTRAGRPTPAGIYAQAGTREEALALFERHGYLL